MIFLNDDHAEKWADAVQRTGSLMEDDNVKGDFAASLFIITGIPWLYGRVMKHLHDGWIDFEPMLSMGLSSGEKTLVSLAGNLYNGGFFEDLSPYDIVAYCDSQMVKLAAAAIQMRARSVNINTVYD